MKSLVLRQNNNWACFNVNNPSFISVLKVAIKPSSYRLYDHNNGCWKIHWSKIPDLVTIAKRFNYYVDWSGLPDEWQVYIAGGRINSSYCNEVDEKDYYSVLFVTDDAPIEVIRSAYEALASKYHPDHNNGEGDVEKLKDVMEAYKKILEIRKN